MAIPTIVITALVFSWIESFFILPNHLAHFVKEPPQRKSKKVFNKVKASYQRALGYALRYRYPFAVVLILAFVGVGYIGANKLKHNFDLNINSEQITVFVTLKESPDLAYARNATRSIEDYLFKYSKEEVSNVYTSVGNVWMNGRMRESKRFIKIRAQLNPDHSYPTTLKKRMKKEIEDFVATVKDDRIEKLDVEIERQNQTDEKKDLITIHVSGDDQVDYIQVEQEITAAAVSVAQIKRICSRCGSLSKELAVYARYECTT